jgi:hypothetical protein
MGIWRQLFSQPVLREDEVAFVICVEANRLEPQARMLCESIRTFGGRYRNAPIFAISPRPALALGHEARAQLSDLGVTYVAQSLNETGSPYGPINRIVAGAWAENHCLQPYLVVLDTDMIFVGEPVFLRVDVGVRPADCKGSASGGATDPADIYWRRMCHFGGIEPSRLPQLITSIDRHSIRASYNGGFCVVRRKAGVLQRTQEIFFASFRENLRPLAGSGTRVFSSTGDVGEEASEWWGSSQAALSIAIWSSTSNVHVYDERYNIPLNLLAEPANQWPMAPGQKPVLLHYHHLAIKEFQSSFERTLTRIDCDLSTRQWISTRLPMFDTARSLEAEVA